MSNPLFQLIQSYHLWHELFNNSFEQGMEATINYNYDYQATTEGKKCVYIDLSFKLNKASVVYRSGFEFNENSLTWKDIFVTDTVQSMLRIAFDETLKGYIIFCKANNLQSLNSCEIPDALIVQFANTMIEQYTLYHSVSDEQNSYLINTTTFECESGSDTYLMFKYTFDILQEVLFYHPHFNRVHNREVFSDIIPLSRYFTLRYNTKAIEFEDIALSGVDMILFFQCMDCALQMLVGNKSDSIISALEPQGFDAKTRAEFITIGTFQFNQLMTTLKESNARILNFEDRVDWLNIIR